MLPIWNVHGQIKGSAQFKVLLWVFRCGRVHVHISWSKTHDYITFQCLLKTDLFLLISQVRVSMQPKTGHFCIFSLSQLKTPSISIDLISVLIRAEVFLCIWNLQFIQNITLYLVMSWKLDIEHVITYYSTNYIVWNTRCLYSIIWCKTIMYFFIALHQIHNA